MADGAFVRSKIAWAGVDMLGIRQKVRRWRVRSDRARRLNQMLKRPMTCAEVQALQLNRDLAYSYFQYYFDHFLPEPIFQHREYFSAQGRGFGEEAFHAMWFLLFQHFQPASALEIGVYRRQTITLWKLLGRHLGFDCAVACISPFNASGDSVSTYDTGIDYFEDTMRNHRRFELDLPECCKSLSTAPEAHSFIRSRPWNLIYIDGNHDYAVAKSDWDVCSQALAPHGIIVLDDSALHTDFHPLDFSTAGHPGPSRVADEINKSQFEEVLAAGHNRVFQKLA